LESRTKYCQHIQDRSEIKRYGSISIADSNPIFLSLPLRNYIPYLGMEKGGVTPSICCLTSVSHTNRNLGHECCKFLIKINVCQSYQQESAARMPQIFDHRSISVSHTTRNLRHVCRRIFLNLSVVRHLAGTSMKSAARMLQIFCQSACQKLISGKRVLDYKRYLYINVKFNNWEKYVTFMLQICQWIVYIFIYT
jgi:hypothetical protein